MDYQTNETGQRDRSELVPSVPSIGDLTLDSKVLYMDPQTHKYWWLRA